MFLHPFNLWVYRSRTNAGGSAHCLEYNGNKPLLPVEITDGQRNPLSCFIHLNDYKFTWLAGSGYTRCFHVHQINLVCQAFCLNNLVHGSPPDLLKCYIR